MSELKEKMKSYNELCTLEKEIIGKIIEQVESIEEIPVCKSLSSNSIIFVNYVKTLCKQHYVNLVYL